MHYVVKLLSSVAVSTVLVPIIQIPSFSGERLALMPPLLAQVENIGSRKAEAEWLLLQGVQRFNTSQFQEAIQSWQRSLTIYHEIGDRQGEGLALGNLANAYFGLEQYQQAIEFSKEAIAIFREIGDLARERAALQNLGISYSNLEQYQQAINFHEQGLAIARDLNDRAGEGAALEGLGNAYNKLEQYQQAIDIYEQGLAIARDLDDHVGEGAALEGLGFAYLSLEEYQQAINFYEQYLSIVHEIRAHEEFPQESLRKKGSALGGLGTAYAETGYYQQAIALFEQHLAIAQEIGDQTAEGSALGNLGNVYNSLGQHRQAIGFYEEYLAISRETSDHTNEGIVLGNLGDAYNNLGQYQQAIDFHEQHLIIAREIGDQSEEGRALGNLGNVYNRLGQYQQAIDFHEKHLAIALNIGNRRGESRALSGLGIANHFLGQYPQAINFHEQSLAISREIGNREGEGSALGNLGIAYYSLGDYRRAIEFYEQHLAVTREIRNRPGEGAALGNLGVAYANLELYPQAVTFYEHHLAVAREIDDIAGEAIALNNQGSLLNSLGDFPQAASVLQQSIAVFESLRTDLPDSQLISIADTQREAYQNLELALVAENKTDQALAITERGRARAFVLQLANRLNSSADQDTIAKPPAIADIQQIARDTNSTLVTYSQISDQSLYIWVVQPSGEIAFRSVEFEGSGNAGFAINPIANIDGPVYRSAPDESELGQLVADSRASIVIESTNTRPEQLRELHTLLIDPIADLLPTDPEAKVVFVPQGNLFLVPFAALQDAEGTYLIEKHTILTAPSIQVFGLANEAASLSPSETLRERLRSGGSGRSLSPAGRLRQRLRSGNALIVGNPTMPTVWLPAASGGFAETQLTDLPGAKAEAEAIGGFLNITPLIGDQATEARVKQLLPSARLIHLATHGLLDYGDPSAYGRLDVPGAIALTPDDTEDGLLTSAEILEMDLQAELAVLSACDTGRGRITGDGVVGLSRALITAGVPSVVVSLWAVPDAPTAELMTEFYRQLDQGQDKAQALRQAMLITLEQHPNPRNWAAFTLMGAAE